jgi:hypothetical protein
LHSPYDSLINLEIKSIRETHMSAQYADRPTREVRYDVDNTTVVTPTDRVRWAAVIAGLFTAMAALIFFAVLGIAIGLEVYDAGDPARNFGIGTGIYSIITGLIAFFFGGFIAARTAAVGGRGNGLLNGAMVWIVTIVLIVNFLGTGISTLLGTTITTVGDVAGAAVQTVPDIAGNVANEVEDAANAVGVDTAQIQATAEVAAQGVATQAANAVNEIEQAVSPQNLERLAEGGADSAWTVLLALGLTAFAAIIGGLLGARSTVYVR